MGEDFDIESIHNLVDLITQGDARREYVRDVEVTFAHLDSILEEITPDNRQVILEKLREKLLAETNTESLRSIHERVKKCKLCAGLEHSDRIPWGNFANPRVMIVTDRYAEPEYLRTIVEASEEAGLNRQDLYITAAVRCVSENPTSAEYVNCQRYLGAEIETLKPRLIVLCGGPVASSMLGPLKLADTHGRIFWVGPFAFTPTYSPRVLDYRPHFVRDLATAKAFINAS